MFGLIGNILESILESISKESHDYSQFRGEAMTGADFLKTNIQWLFGDKQRAQAVLSSQPAQSLIWKVVHGLSERDLGQVVSYIGSTAHVKGAEVETLLKGLGSVKGKSPEEQQVGGEKAEWSKRVQKKPLTPLAHMHKPHIDEFFSMEIRFLPEVRKMVDFMAASKGMAAAECVESIVVEAINNNRDRLAEGESLLKKFRRLPRVKRYVQEEKLARLEALEAEKSSRHH